MNKNKNSILYKGFRFVLVYSECLMFLYFFIKFIYLSVGEGDLLYVHVGFQTSNLGYQTWKLGLHPLSHLTSWIKPVCININEYLFS